MQSTFTLTINDINDNTNVELKVASSIIKDNTNVELKVSTSDSKCTIIHTAIPKELSTNNSVPPNGAGVFPIIEYDNNLYFILIFEAEEVKLEEFDFHTRPKLINYALDTFGYWDEIKYNKVYNTALRDGFYSSIGGAANINESLIQCAIRETREETYKTIIPTNKIITPNSTPLYYYNEIKNASHISYVIKTKSNDLKTFKNKYKIALNQYWESKKWNLPFSKGNRDYTIGLDIFPLETSFKYIKSSRHIPNIDGVKRVLSFRAIGLLNDLYEKRKLYL